MRSRRHAHTDGLTKWIVRTPRRLSLRSRPRLKSGASTPTNRSTRAVEQAPRELAPHARSARADAAQHFDETAHRELLERVPGLAAGGLHLAGRRCRRSARRGSRARTARDQRRAPSASPDASPATMPIVTRCRSSGAPSEASRIRPVSPTARCRGPIDARNVDERREHRRRRRGLRERDLARRRASRPSR